MRIVCGIDYSLTSPSLVIHKGDYWDFNNCKFYYLTKTDKQIVVNKKFVGSKYPEYSSDMERYDLLSKWSENILVDNQVSSCYMEGYAFAATGKVFNIAENSGILKYNLWKGGYSLRTFAPTEIKKLATEKGNANKEKMYEAFKLETNIDIRSSINITSEKQWNPLSDIVDAYYIAKLGFITG
jgi:Holliday junction resolvasome RuvABC endonuclease subunit